MNNFKDIRVKGVTNDGINNSLTLSGVYRDIYPVELTIWGHDLETSITIFKREIVRLFKASETKKANMTKLLRNLDSKGFEVEKNIGNNNLVYIKNEDGLLSSQGMKGWQLVKLQEIFSSYGLDFILLDIANNSLCLEVITKEEAQEGY